MYKKLITGKKAVFFDLDGTVVDTEPVWGAALGNIYEKHGGSAEKIVYLMLQRGRPLRDKWKEIQSKALLDVSISTDTLVEETNLKFLEFLKELEIDATDEFWKLAAYLKMDKGMKLALATNTKKDIAKIILEKLGIESTFDLYLFGDDVKTPKPSPEIYLKAAKLLEVSPKEVLVFEDSPSGAKAAARAGMDVVIIWDGETGQEEFPSNTKLFLESFAGLADNLEHTFEESFRDFQGRFKDKE